MIDVNYDGEKGAEASVSYEDNEGNSFESAVSGTDLDEVFVDLYSDVVTSIGNLSKKKEEKKDPADMTDAEYIAYLENEIIKLKDAQTKAPEAVKAPQTKQPSTGKTLNDWKKVEKILSNYYGESDALLNFYKKNPLFKEVFKWYV